MQAKHGDDVVSISQIMDLLEVGDTQSLAKLFHGFLDCQKRLQQFNKVENELKDNLRVQKVAFVAKCLKEFHMVNQTKIQAIKWDWNPLWHIVTNE
jgi:hypothetical protein